MTAESPKLVVIDDDKGYLELISRILYHNPGLGSGRSAFFSKIETAENFLAKDESKNNPPIVIVLNLNMDNEPTMDVIKELKGDDSPYKSSKVLVTSSSIEPFTRDLCYDAGANQVYDKSRDGTESLIEFLKHTFSYKK